MKKGIAISIIFVISLMMLCSCGINFNMCEVAFTLNTESEGFSPPQITLIKTKDEFEGFLTNEAIFVEELSQEFQQANAQYDTTFFEKNDLVSIIIQASSSQITGYQVRKIAKENQEIIIHIKSKSPKQATTDMGKYFTYYLTIAKDDNIKKAAIKF
ncbi:MAG: hypothetical protein RR316_04380 [Clostridia bacterium]